MGRLAFFILLLTCSTASAQPNVLLIVADDMSWTDFGLYGGNTRQTPTIDRLARSGAVFGNLVLDSPRCRASLASLMSGRGLLSHGKFQNDTAGSVGAVGTLPHALQQAGYATRCEGKWWEGDPLNCGFDERGPRPNASGDPGFIRLGQSDAISFLIENSTIGKPWFLWYAPQLPHTPHDAPAEFVARFPLSEITVPSYFSGSADQYRDYQQQFLANQLLFDAAVGDILDVIADVGEAANTLVVFLSDNGYLIGEESKNSPHASGWRSPLIFRCPALVSTQQRPDVVTTADIAPTILSLVGVDVPEQMTGRDLFNDTITGPQFGAAFGDSPTGSKADAFAIYGFDGRYSYRRWLKPVPPEHQMGETFLTVVSSHAAGSEECFDLWTDPFEQSPVAVNPSLRDAVTAWWSGQSLPTGEYSRTIDQSHPNYSESGTGWASNTNAGVGFLGSLRHCDDLGSSASWIFDDVSPGNVTISFSWVSHDNRSSAVPYTITDTTGVIGTFTANQRGPHDKLTKWQALGTVTVTQGPLVVTVGTESSGHTIADAVKAESN